MNENSENIGFLIVSVKTADGALPIENAVVYVYPNINPNEEGAENTNEDNSVLYSLRTDESGNTIKVALETKPRDLSLTEGNKIPYKTYNVAVYADGYYNAESVNIPIFEGVTSVQTENLIPLADYADPSSYCPNCDGRYVEIPDTEL